MHDGQYYIEGPRVIFSEKCILSLTIDFVLANSVDSDQMSHLGLHCLPKSIVDKGILMSASNLVALLTLPSLN